LRRFHSARWKSSSSLFAILRGQSAVVALDQSKKLAVDARRARRDGLIGADRIVTLVTLDVEPFEQADQVAENDSAFAGHG